MQKINILFVLALFCISCTPKVDKTNTTLLYFDISGFFNKEAARLTKLNPTVEKRVSIDGNIERKTLKISDWEKELTIFTSSDINKSAWKGSFKIEKLDHIIHYYAIDDKISVKQVSVEEGMNNEPKKIIIIIGSNNILYQSNDTLTYQPNISYQIKKQQKIKLLDAKNYEISGNFK